MEEVRGADTFSAQPQIASEPVQAKAVRKGIILTQAQAVEIYKFKLAFEKDHSRDKETRGQSQLVSRLFSISFKTVKDIWSHKTWKHATCHLWSLKDEESREWKGPGEASIGGDEKVRTLCGPWP
jgi:hypothetical protein